MKGLLKSSVRDDGPVLIFEDTKPWPTKGDVPTDAEYLVPLGKADIKRPGTDVTLVAIAGDVRPALEAATVLAGEGISVEAGFSASVAQARAEIMARTPLRRLARPQDIAGGVVFLCSPAAAFMTGAELVIDGGSLA